MARLYPERVPPLLQTGHKAHRFFPQKYLDIIT